MKFVPRRNDCFAGTSNILGQGLRAKLGPCPFVEVALRPGVSSSLGAASILSRRDFADHSHLFSTTCVNDLGVLDAKILCFEIHETAKSPLLISYFRIVFVSRTIPSASFSSLYNGVLRSSIWILPSRERQLPRAH